MAHRPQTLPPPRPRNAGGPPVGPPYKRLLIGLAAWVAWWLLLGHTSQLGWLGIPAFLAIAEAWPLFQTIVEIRAGRRKWSRPPGFWIAFYAFGSVWLALLLTVILVLPWSGTFAAATNLIVKLGGAIGFGAVLWVASRLAAGR